MVRSFTPNVEMMAFSETAKRHPRKSSDPDHREGTLPPDALASHALKSLSDQALFRELGIRGYDLAERRENQPTQTEIVKIG